MKETRPGTEALVLRDEPQVDDPPRQATLRREMADERVVTLAAVLGAQHIVIGTGDAERISERDGRHVRPVPAQTGDGLPAERPPVEKDEPRAGGLLGAEAHIRQRRPPDRLPSPAGHVALLCGRSLLLGIARGDAIEEVTLMLEGIGWQVDPARRGRGVEPLERNPKAGRPGAAERGEEMQPVVGVLVGMRKAVYDLIGGDALGLGKRAEHAPGADLDENARRLGGEHGDAVGEADRRAQVPRPVCGVARFRGREPGPGQVGDDRNGGCGQRRSPEERLEAIENRLQHPGMGGDVDRNAARVQPVGDELLAERLERLVGPRHDAKLRCVDGGDVEIVGEPRGERFVRQGDAQHAAGRNFLEQLAAQADEVDRALEAQDTGDARGRVLAHRMANQGRRLHAPAHPKTRDGDLDDEDGRKLQRRAQQAFGGVGRVGARGQPHVTDLARGGRRQIGEPFVDNSAERGLVAIERARHMRILCAAARKQEDGLDCPLDQRMRKCATGIRGGEHRDRILAIGDRDHAAVLEMTAAGQQRRGNILERLILMGFHVRSEPASRLVERLAAPRREHQHLRADIDARRVRFPLRRLLDDDVRVRAADAERVHAGPARRDTRGPRRQAICNDERALGEVDRGVGLLEAERRRDLAMLHGERRLDQAHDAGRGVEMADVGLHRADTAEPALVGGLPERLSQRLDLDRVAEVGARAMAFDVADAVGLDARQRLRLDDGFRLSGDAGREVARLARAVVVDGGCLDDGVNRIAVG